MRDGEGRGRSDEMGREEWKDEEERRVLVQ